MASLNSQTRRNAFTRWNNNRGPSGLRELGVWLLFVVPWTLGTYAYSVPSHYSWMNWLTLTYWWSGFSRPFVGYVWMTLLGAGISTMLFVEFNRLLFSLRILQPYGTTAESLCRKGRRVEPIITGAIERLLLTTVAVPLINQYPTAVAVIVTGYVALKGYKRTLEGQPTTVTIHSVWGSGVSAAMATLGAWLFWHAQEFRL